MMDFKWFLELLVSVYLGDRESEYQITSPRIPNTTVSGETFTPLSTRGEESYGNLRILFYVS